jgi:hypothetical protein
MVYNNLMMKNFKQFLLVVLLAWCCQSVTFSVRGPVSTEGFKCLLANTPGGTAYALVRAYQNAIAPAGIDPTAVQTLKNSNAAGNANDLSIDLCRGVNATSQIQLVLNQVYAATPGVRYFPGLYLKVIPTVNPVCSWTGYTGAANCLYLKEAVQAVRNIGRTPAVYATSADWKLYFGTSCDTFATDTGAYLWYANYQTNGIANSVQSSADYVPFGGWLVSGRRVWVKKVGDNVPIGYICGSGFVDLIHPTNGV